ncbi:MAG TPA: UbiX family flavin prenyltransferase [Thermoanaerobaculia bacterium]
MARSQIVAGSEIIVGVSGGSGARLAARFVQVALAAAGSPRLHLVVTGSALEVARGELSREIDTPAAWVAHLRLPRAAARRIALHDNADVGASIASGSYPAAAMIVIPCSGGTLGSIANGVSRDLLQRAADVCLKEQRPLVLAFRESPYSLVHIENMRRVTLAGAIVAPPSPAFYVEPPTPSGSPPLDRFLDAYCVRVARLVGLSPRGEQYRWEPDMPKPKPKPKRKRAAKRPRPRRRP